MENTLLQNILEYSLLIAILGFISFLFWKEIQRKDGIIQQLNDKLVDLFVKNIEVVNSLKTTIESLKQESIEDIKELKPKFEAMQKTIDEIKQILTHRT